jgi:hypothetical protein
MSTYQSARRATEHPALQQINLSYLRPDGPLPLVVRPAREGVDLGLWAAANSHFIEAYLLRNGAILFRDFGLATEAAFEQFIEAVSGPLLDYSYRSTPRHIVSGRIY